MVAGGRGVGKTEFTKSLIQHRERIMSPAPVRMVWCYAKHQPRLLQDLIRINPSIEYINGIPADVEEMFDTNTTNLIVIDDMMDVSNLFTRGRHTNLSVIFLTQNLFHKKQREISLNSDYIVVFKNPRDRSQFSHLARQFMPHKKAFIQWAYSDATHKSYSYLLLDLKADTDERYRVRSNIVPTINDQNDGDNANNTNFIQYVYIPST